jgi:DNA-binding MarR family transcriptional regulator
VNDHTRRKRLTRPQAAILRAIWSHPERSARQHIHDCRTTVRTIVSLQTAGLVEMRPATGLHAVTYAGREVAATFAPDPLERAILTHLLAGNSTGRALAEEVCDRQGWDQSMTLRWCDGLRAQGRADWSREHGYYITDRGRYAVRNRGGER